MDKVDGTTKDPVILRVIPEKTARLTVVLMLLLAVGAYVFGLEVILKIGLTLLIFGGSGLLLILGVLGFAWLCVGSLKLNHFLGKHESNVKMASVFIAASLIGGAMSFYLLIH